MFGRRGNPDHADGIRIIHRALGRRHQRRRHRRRLPPGRVARRSSARRSQGRRDDVFLATKFHGQIGDDPNHRATPAAGSSARSRTACAGCGTDWIDLYQVHRPEPGHRLRRDARRALRPGAPGQDPLHRHLHVRAVGDRRGPVDRREAGPRAGGRRAAAVLDAGARHRARGAAGRAAVRPRGPPVEPARRRLAVRPLPQGLARSRRPAERASRPASTSTLPENAAKLDAVDALAGWPRKRGSRWSTSRWRSSSSTRRSPRRSSGRAPSSSSSSSSGPRGHDAEPGRPRRDRRDRAARRHPRRRDPGYQPPSLTDPAIRRR